MKIKFWIIRIGYVLVFGGLIANLYVIQVNKSAYYMQQAHAQDEASGAFQARRGVIYMTDKNNNDIPVVLNKDYPVIYAVPKELEHPLDAAHTIASIMGMSSQQLEKSFSKKNDLYELIKEKATDEEVEYVREQSIPGIYVRNQTFRFYPFGTMAAHLLGFISSASDGTIAGRYGLELQFDKTLRGISGSDTREPLQGQGVYLTIDRTIQAEAEKIISDLMDEWHADSASVLVQDPESGKILAMANLPNFDPNDYAHAPISNFLNASVQSLYEPGSVFKIMTMSAGIDAGKITPDTTYTDKGYVKFGPWTIRNWDGKAHGVQTMTNVIEQSLNTGTIFAEETMGNDIFRSYVEKFGFGELTHIQLPGEVKGSIYNVEHSKEAVDYATASYGQGISVTPIRLITAASAIANGGLLLKPLIVRDEPTEVVRRVISEDTSKKVVGMMVSAVDKNILAAIPDYTIAGKTGTAYIPKNGKYTDNVINTFLGFAPASHPRFTVLIKLANPSHAPLAGQTVVPAFKKLTQFLLNYYNVPPDRIPTN